MFAAGCSDVRCGRLTGISTTVVIPQPFKVCYARSMMLRRLYDVLLTRRATRLIQRVDAHLPAQGTLLDYGCGTGHNAFELRRRRPDLTVLEADVVCLSNHHQILRIVNGRVPLGDSSVDCLLMFYVLHYPSDPSRVLRELHRLGRSRLILLQTTADDAFSRWLWRWRDALMGRWAFRVCRALRLTPNVPCSMDAISTRFTKASLLNLLEKTGWKVTLVEEQRWIGTTLSRNLIVADKQGEN